MKLLDKLFRIYRKVTKNVFSVCLLLLFLPNYILADQAVSFDGYWESQFPQWTEVLLPFLDINSDLIINDFKIESMLRTDLASDFLNSRSNSYRESCIYEDPKESLEPLVIIENYLNNIVEKTLLASGVEDARIERTPFCIKIRASWSGSGVHSGPYHKNGLISIPVHVVLLASSENELALIIMHEVAHALYLHGIQSKYPREIVEDSSLKNKIKQQAEATADKFAIKTLLNAEYDVDKATKLLKKLRGKNSGQHHLNPEEFDWLIGLIKSGAMREAYRRVDGVKVEARELERTVPSEVMQAAKDYYLHFQKKEWGTFSGWNFWRNYGYLY